MPEIQEKFGHYRRTPGYQHLRWAYQAVVHNSRAGPVPRSASSKQGRFLNKHLSRKECCLFNRVGAAIAYFTGSGYNDDPDCPAVRSHYRDLWQCPLGPKRSEADPSGMFQTSHWTGYVIRATRYEGVLLAQQGCFAEQTLRVINVFLGSDNCKGIFRVFSVLKSNYPLLLCWYTRCVIPVEQTCGETCQREQHGAIKYLQITCWLQKWLKPTCDIFNRSSFTSSDRAKKSASFFSEIAVDSFLLPVDLMLTNWMILGPC